MKKSLIFAICVMAVALAATVAVVSCKKETVETMITGEKSVDSDTKELCNRDLIDPTLDDSLAPIINTKIPVFPMEVLFVVNKEYELVVEGRSDKTHYLETPILSMQQPEYVELRLIELYPNVAYEGVIEDSRVFFDSVSKVYADYVFCLDEPSEKRLKPEIPYVSEKDEMKLMEMTKEEKETYLRYIELAAMKGFASLDDIFKVGGKNQIMEAKFNWTMFGCICALVLTYGSYAYYRALICAERATDKANAYFPGNTGPGRKGDAFRHIAASVMLRYYLGEVVAYLIMDVYYEYYDSPNNPPCDRHMDHHNNAVGRFYKYYYFRTDDSWTTWMTRIKDYINNNSNAAYKNWNSNTPWATVVWQRTWTSRFKYIYYQN